MYCKETRQVLSWHISEGRFFKDAKTVLLKAKQVADGRPEKIITDRLFAYGAAIKKAMGWHWRVHKKKHIIDTAIGQNYIVERVNREVKRRVKWFSTFQCLEGAKAFFSLFLHYFNLRTAKARQNRGWLTLPDDMDFPQ